MLVVSLPLQFSSFIFTITYQVSVFTGKFLWSTIVLESMIFNQFGMWLKHMKHQLWLCEFLNECWDISQAPKVNIHDFCFRSQYCFIRITSCSLECMLGWALYHFCDSRSYVINSHRFQKVIFLLCLQTYFIRIYPHLSKTLSSTELYFWLLLDIFNGKSEITLV